jgi:hypothetical protein
MVNKRHSYPSAGTLTMRFSRTLYLLPLTVFAILLTSLAQADFQAGQDAYERADYSTALKEWQPLAEQGNAVAQVALANLYYFGEGVPQDFGEAVYWNRLAAEQGFAFAQYNLGVLYERGQGVPQGFGEAVYWHRLAAEQGFADAQYNLGVIYGQGQGVSQDYGEAARWYRLAAEQGNSKAQFNLSIMYDRGLGVLQDYVQAHMWANLAAAQDQERALALRDTLAEQMTPGKIAEAQRLAREWLAQHQK